MQMNLLQILLARIYLYFLIPIFQFMTYETTYFCFVVFESV